MTEQLGLFPEADALPTYDPVTVTAWCGRCLARSEPIPLTESGNPGDPWTGVNVWGYLAIAGHRDTCPGDTTGRTVLATLC